MSIHLFTEILAEHADQLNRVQNVKSDKLLMLHPDERDDVASLMNLAARLKRALKPAELDTQFRSRLQDGLTMAARHSASQKILIERRDSTSPWGWVIGAAALGSAAGLIAIAWRARGHRQSVSSIAQESAQSN